MMSADRNTHPNGFDTPAPKTPVTLSDLKGGNNEQFVRVVEDTRAKCNSVLVTKGKDYSGEDDRYREFKDTANRLGLTEFQVLATYLNKHINSVFRAIKDNPTSPVLQAEHISEKIIDIHNYLYFLSGLLDIKEQENPNE